MLSNKKKDPGDNHPESLGIQIIIQSLQLYAAWANFLLAAYFLDLFFFVWEDIFSISDDNSFFSRSDFALNNTRFSRIWKPWGEISFFLFFILLFSLRRSSINCFLALVTPGILSFISFLESERSEVEILFLLQCLNVASITFGGRPKMFLPPFFLICLIYLSNKVFFFVTCAFFDIFLFFDSLKFNYVNMKCK